MKVSPAFSKAAGCRGSAPARAPQSAELSLCLLKRRRGSKGEPSPGVPPFLYACTCAPIRWEVFVTLPCDSTPFLWCLPKETVSSRQRKALLTPPHHLGGPAHLSHLGVSPNGTNWCVKLTCTWWFTGHSSQLDAVGGDVGASSPWERRVGPNMSRGGTQKRVSLGLHPVSLRKSKEMGWNGQ